MNQIRFEKALALYNSGHCEDAIRELRSLEREFNDPNEKTLVLISEHKCYCELGRLDEADRVIGRIRKLAPTELEVRIIVDFGEACMHAQMGKFEKAVLEFEGILTFYSDVLQNSRRDLFESIQIRRGVALSNIGKYSEARAILHEASGFADLADDDKQEIHFYLAVCYRELHENELAKEEYLKAIAFGINNDLEAHAHYAVALIYFKARAFAQAKLHLEAILRTHGTNIPNLPIKYVYEQLSHVCKHLGESDESKRYADLAKTV
jgi:tetratricopeptide (TPR) repeat protein